jgi:hypothetical protein
MSWKRVEQTALLVAMVLITLLSLCGCFLGIGDDGGDSIRGEGHIHEGHDGGRHGGDR